MTRSLLSLTSRIIAVEQRIHRASTNYNTLSVQHRQLERRRKHAKRRNQRSIFYNVTLRLGVLEGVMNMFIECIRMLNEESRELRWLISRYLDVDDDDDFDSEIDEGIRFVDDEDSDDSDYYADSDRTLVVGPPSHQA